MLRCGLLGRTLGHSYSPQIHKLLGDYRYDLFEVEPENLEDFIKNGRFDGINVTIPYKKAVMPFLDEISQKAQEIGSVNTVVRRADGSLYGDNTDADGFLYLLKTSGICVEGRKCLVFGSGGASVTAVWCLKNCGAKEVLVVSRSGEVNYENLSSHRDAEILVNTTPLGMFPKTGVSPVQVAEFPNCCGALDVVYNPARTEFLLQAEALGIPHAGGLSMLVAQAKRASELFTGSQIPDEKIAEITKILAAQMQNIVLIGMPGCGKSTIGKLLAERLEKQFSDADAEIEKAAGKPIPQIFAESGEEGFRKIETEVLRTLGKQSGLVLSCGGGVITREENYPLLHQNGTIFYLTRDLDKLPTNGRPLSQANPLAALFAARKAGYERFADFIIDNNGTPDNTVQNILEVLQ